MSLDKNLRIPLKWELIKNGLSKYGFSKSIKIAYSRIYDLFFDKYYGTDTVSLARLEKLEVGVVGQKRGNQYQPSGILNTRKILKQVSKYNKNGFVDFGSGKGQVLLEACNWGYTSIKGVEFAAELCEIADRNVTAYCNKTNSKIVPKTYCIDAAKFKNQPEDDLLYFFHPFKGELIEEVLNNIVQTKKNNPNEIILVYYLPIYRDKFDERFTLLESFFVDDYECLVYKL